MKRKLLKLKNKSSTLQKQKEIESLEKIDRKELLEVCKALVPGLATSEMIDQATHFVFFNDTIATYNDQICVIVPFYTGLECSVKAKYFHKLIDLVDSDSVVLSQVKRDNENYVTVKGKGFNFKLSAVEEGSVREYIKSIDLDSITWKALPDWVLDAFSLCSFSIASSAIILHLTGICVSGTDVLSSDRFRISWFKSKKKLGQDFIIPGKSIPHLIKHDPTHYCIGDGWIHFKNAMGIIFSVVLIAEEYPDVKSFFNVELKEENKIQIDRAKFKTVIHRSKVLLDEVDWIDKKVKLHFEGKEVRCFSEQEGAGSFEEFITLKSAIDGEFTITVNPEFLEQALERVVDIYYVDNSRVVLTSSNFKHVISLVKEEE